jgi:hypothetical protein
MEWFVETPDGRTLAVEDAGDRGGRPVLVHVGTPGGACTARARWLMPNVASCG